MAKSAFVAIAGRPSAGKSTLVNALCGEKVSIVSPVPQTTRNTIRGIVNKPEGQLVFLDTPGYHLSQKKLNLRLKKVSDDAFADADIVLYLIDASRKPGSEEDAVASALIHASDRLVVGINKIDSPEANAISSRSFVSSRFPNAPVCELSALRGIGLDALLSALFALAPEGPSWYPTEYYTDQEPIFRIAEIIREKIFLYTKDEMPHAVYVSYEDSSRGGGDSLSAEFDLVVERETQKGILIGKGGSMIKRIREEAEKDLATIFDYSIRLKLSVRVDPDWKKNDKRLDKLIY